MKPITFYPQIAIELGSIEAAIFYQQLFYWSDKGSRPDGFIYKTKEEITEETTISRFQQDKIRTLLVKKGWLEVKKIKANGVPTLHYKPLKDIQILISEKLTNGKVRNSPMETRVSSDSLTENTTENTNKNTNTAETSSAGLITEVIKAFETINPASKKFYGNTTQRKACLNLLEEYGAEQVFRIIAYLPRSNSMAYVPTITTPLQLWEKWEALRSGLMKKRSEINSKARGLEL